MRRLVVILGLTVYLAGGGQALPSTGAHARAGVTFKPSADAYVSSAARRSNFGRARVLRVGAPSPYARTYLRFQVSGLDAPVTRATLRVFPRTTSRGFSVGRTSGRWSERRITFANAPRVFHGVGSSGRVRPRRWVSVDVTRAVRGNGTVNLLLSGRGATTLASRESGATRPQLIVDATPPTLIAAGDIAYCGTPWDEATASLVAKIPGTVAALGDLAYESGTSAEFAACYQPSWGKFKARTRPAPGNREYQTPNAAGYFAYWGAVAGNPTQGWYSYDLGGWHVVSLNSNCPSIGGCQAGSAEETWLRADLSAHPAKCTVAYWHHPLFSGGQVQNELDMQPLWQALYDNNADLVLSGHAHNYQRFAPQTASGVLDPARGIREFIVGTGGHPRLDSVAAIPNTEVMNNTTWGVLKLTLSNNGYDWTFVRAAGGTFTDSGSQACH